MYYPGYYRSYVEPMYIEIVNEYPSGPTEVIYVDSADQDEDVEYVSASDTDSDVTYESGQEIDPNKVVLIDSSTVPALSQVDKSYYEDQDLELVVPSRASRASAMRPKTSIAPAPEASSEWVTADEYED